MLLINREQTALSIFQWAINRRPDYWTRVDEYVPERWLDDPEFKNDNRAAMQPFVSHPPNRLIEYSQTTYMTPSRFQSVGARNCIGRK